MIDDDMNIVMPLDGAFLTRYKGEICLSGGFDGV